MTIYLYKKTHNQTGLKYLGKTIQDPYKYKGSGKRWKPHIKKHGYDVTTEILRECQTKEEIKQWGQYYSALWNVVYSDEWANLKPEEGDGGITCSGEKHPMKKECHRNTVRAWWTTERRVENGIKTIQHSENRTPEKQQEINQKLKNTWSNNPDRKTALSERMVSDNPSKTDRVIKKIAETKANWTEEYRKSVLAKTSGENHYRNDPTYVSSQIGHGHPRFDPELRTFRHKTTGEEVSLTVFDFIRTYNLHQGNVSLMIHGYRKSVKGWTLIR